MLKFLLAALVIIVFVIYALHPNFGDSNVNVTPPQSTSLSSLPSPTPSASAPANMGNQMMQGNSMMGAFKDGTYTGSMADAYYGNVQVRATITSGKITNIEFLQYPNSRGHSIEVSSFSLPILKQEAISTQSSRVDIVSGATQTSLAFMQSLSSALAQAQ